MFDPRIEKLAKVLINYSLRLKKGDWLVIFGPYIAEELIKACAVEAFKVGANVSLRLSIPDLTYLFFRYATRAQIRYISPFEWVEHEKADAFLFIGGAWNTKELTNVDAQKLTQHRKVRRPLFDLRLKREAEGSLRWVITQFPTDSSSQDAEMSRPEYEEFVYNAALVDKKDPIKEWQKISLRQRRLIQNLNRLEKIRVVGEDTDITFSVKGRKWVNCDGHRNFPDGEVFTSPVEDKTEGKIRFSFPAVYSGKEVQNVRLVFKNGKVVQARADKGEDLLKAMIQADEGAKRVGELSFGTNYSIKRWTKNILFDEKIGGTMHLALGAALPDTGGKNKSAIHWDMICDTRKGFTVYGDDQPIMRNGKFLIG